MTTGPLTAGASTTYPAPFGKRIKRLGVHLLLQDGYPAEEAAGYLTGMRAKDIAALCEARGF